MEEWSKKMINGYEEPRKTAFQENIMKIKKFLIKDKPCLLDVGCSLGTFMSIAQKEGWDVFGVELHPIFYKYVASKFKDRVYHGQFPNIISSGKKFDIITLFEVLEHSTQPKVLLERAKEYLNRDGIIVISVPSAGFQQLKIFLYKHIIKIRQGSRFYRKNVLIHSHIFSFSLKSLKKLLISLFQKAVFREVLRALNSLPFCKIE